MKPARFRRQGGFRVLATAAFFPAITGTASAQQSLAQTLSTTQSSLAFGAAPLAITLGATAFGLGVMAFAVLQRRRNEELTNSAVNELSKLRARLDHYETMMSTMPEVTLLWGQTGEPKALGDVQLICGVGRTARDVTFFSNWLTDGDATALTAATEKLVDEGRGFDLSLTNRSGTLLRVVGRPTGMGCAVRFRVANTTSSTDNVRVATLMADGASASKSSVVPTSADLKSAQTILSALHKPAWIRDQRGELVFVNSAYLQLATEMGLPHTDEGDLPEIFSTKAVRNQIGELGAAGTAITKALPLTDYPQYELVLFPYGEGTIGYLGSAREQGDALLAAAHAHIPGVINALGAPVIVFAADGTIMHVNKAYADLWALDESWLRSGVTESQILDRLRAERLLPAVADYQGWRREHLKNHALREAKEDTWHLPDGRTINFVAAPAQGDGGLIYVFEDVTERLKLETANKALVSVQRETLNALSEGVAVFSTDGRLRLHNPRVSSLWKLPLNTLGQRPHINELAAEMARLFPEDGKRIWNELKGAVINLNPKRDDLSGRINRSDGRLIDYAAVRLPNGQTMLTFVDVTQAANYERMLTERNEALLIADRLKDAFVQSVSYELRSPLTNIIGFADLLASEVAGPLTTKQRQYADYIRASSTTLGVLIDNILDLTNVDAGIAELHVEPQDIAELIAQARTGLDAASLGRDKDDSVNLRINLPDDLPVIQADGKRVVQILYNLMSNAAKFSEPGSEISLSVEKAGDFVRLIVEDEGFGVPADVRSALLERIDGRSIAGRQRGAGMGLTIAQAFTELHGGRLSIQDREPRGSRVVVTLPIASQVRTPNAADDQDTVKHPAE